MSYLDELATHATGYEARLLAACATEIRDAIVEQTQAAKERFAPSPIHGITPDGGRVVIARERITHVTFGYGGRGTHCATIHLDGGSTVTVIDQGKPIL